jgi:hypothetical protein
MAAMPGAWLRRKVRQPWDGGPHVLRDARLSDLEAELEQFAMDARRSSQQIFRANPPDQRAEIRGDLRVGLQASGISDANTGESRPDANARGSRAG